MTDLLGIDVGFSATQRSTGIALLHQRQLVLYRANASWEDRKREMPANFYPCTVAVDGPLIPAGADDLVVRSCEQFFSRGLFCKRCKPGLSHFGTGLSLRQAAQDTGRQVAEHFTDNPWVLGDRLVEAFPNLFLGVLVTESQYAAIPKLRRGQKFDWLYDCAKEKLTRFKDYTDIPDDVYIRAEQETDHELRAALICLLTAALAAESTALRVGCSDEGWFWLPPLKLWEPWAIAAVERGLEGEKDLG